MHNHEMNLAWQYIADTNISVFLTPLPKNQPSFSHYLAEVLVRKISVVAPIVMTTPS